MLVFKYGRIKEFAEEKEGYVLGVIENSLLDSLMFFSHFTFSFSPKDANTCTSHKVPRICERKIMHYFIWKCSNKYP